MTTEKREFAVVDSEGKVFSQVETEMLAGFAQLAQAITLEPDTYWELRTRLVRYSEWESTEDNKHMRRQVEKTPWARFLPTPQSEA